MRRILLLGGASPTGIVIAREVLAVYKTCPLILLVEDPDKLPVDLASHRDVIVVIGHLEDADAMSRVMEGASAVIAALGPEGTSKSDSAVPPDHVIAAFHNITTCMRLHSVKRIIFTGPPTIHAKEDAFNLTIAAISMILLIFVVRERIKEYTAFGNWVLKEMGDLDWTIVRVGFMKDGGNTSVQAGFITGDRGTSVSRTGAAAFIVQQLSSPSAWIQKAPYLTS